jgi:protease I
MADIAVIVDDMFEDSEYTEPVEAFRKNGHNIHNIGLEKGRVVRGKGSGSEVTIDMGIGEARSEDHDALLIPGGYSPDHLRSDGRAVNFVKEFMDKGKPVFSICHGAQLLITADVLKGRKVTGWKSIVQDIINAGAEYEDTEVVVDGNLVSSRQPSDLPAFIEASLDKIAK